MITFEGSQAGVIVFSWKTNSEKSGVPPMVTELEKQGWFRTQVSLARGALGSLKTIKSNRYF